MKRVLLLLGIVAVCATGCTTATSDRPGATAPAAESFVGPVRASLTALPAHPGRVVARLWRDGRPLADGGVVIRVSRLLQPASRIYVPRAVGNAYQASPRLAGRRWWSASIDVPMNGRIVSIPFLLESSSSSAAAVYPLFSPVGGLKASATLALGREAVQIQVAIGASGASVFTLRLRPPARFRPRVSLRLSMLDMAMPSSAVYLRRRAGGQYVGRGFFSMPGIWEVRLDDGPNSAAAALVIGTAGTHL